MTGPQVEILQIDERPERCWDVEGAARSAKSWGIGFWIWKLVYQYPGIQVFYCRYKDDDLITLKDVWAKVGIYFPGYLHPTWNGSDWSWDFANGSRVFLSSLKVSEAADAEAIHGKYKGKTIAVVIIEEAQEVPKANYIGLKERLSQSKNPAGESVRYPLKIVLVHNAIDQDHWIATEFPLAADGDTCTRDGHQHIRADLYSNQHNLGPDVMAGYEFDYPPGNPLRHTKIEGKRGVTLLGTPVYAHSFRRMVHVHPDVKFTPYYPIIEGWDFGEEKPAVVWWQYLRHRAAIRILGAVKGSEVFLELFAPKVLEIRTRLFPQCKEFRSWCDPTGATGNGGLQFTPVQLLHDLGIPARPCKASEGSKDGNDAEVRYKAIQTIAGYMLKQGTDGKPAFRLAPQCIELVREGSELLEQSSSILVTAFEAGYIWDTKAASEDKPNIRKPKKGTRYDDLMNCFSADTEVLTRERGWQPFAALEGSESLATVNLETEGLEYQQPSRLFSKEWDGELLEFKGKRMSVAVTPQHRMLVHPWTSFSEKGEIAYQHTDAPVFRHAGDVSACSLLKLAPMAAWRGAEYPFAELEAAGTAPNRQIDAGDWAEFLGWYVAEGCSSACVRIPGHGYQVNVSQRPGPKRMLLESLLARMPWAWYSRPDGMQASSKQLWMTLRPMGDKYTKRVPEWVRNGSSEIIRRFLVGAVLGDGSVTPNGQQGYFTVSQQLADDVQELFLKLGRSARVRRVAAKPYSIEGRTGTNTRDQFHVWENRPLARLKSPSSGELIRPMPYRGMVYCATVPNSTLVTRRDGIASVSGNSLEYGVIGENIPIAPSVQMLQQAVAQYQTAPEREALAERMAEARQLKLAQRDYDRADRDDGRRSRRGVL